MHTVRRFMLEFIEFFFISCKPMKRSRSWAIMFCVLSPLSCARATACYPSLKTTTARGLIVGFFDLKHVREPLPSVPLSAADTISSAGPRVGPRRQPPPPSKRGCDKLI